MSSVIIDYEEGEESFRQTSNQQILKNNSTNIVKKQPEISEEEEYLAQQQNTVNFGKNMQLGESRPLDVSQPDIQQYVDKIKELQRELAQRDEQIQKLSNELT